MAIERKGFKMKQRNGFVSNSSSSSFIINLDAVTPDQLEKLVRYATADPKIVQSYAKTEEDRGGCGWFLDICGNHIRGTTYMSDYDLRAWILHLGIPSNAMSFETEHHRGIDTWANYQNREEFRAEAKKHLGEWIAYDEHDGNYVTAPTYVALRYVLQKKWEKELNELKKDGCEHPEKLEENIMPAYITWIDPAYLYICKEDSKNDK